MKMTDKEFIKLLAEKYAELRSDVSDACYDQLSEKFNPEEFTPEHRFIQARIPHTSIEIEYDTLTTELSFHTPLCQWELCIEHKYLDN